MVYTSSAAAVDDQSEVGDVLSDTGFFDLEFKAVSPVKRTREMKRIARNINSMFNPDNYTGPPGPPDALILLKPEGYGKSRLVVELVRKGSKVIFGTKSNTQLEEKEKTMRERWGLTTTRFVSREHNFQTQLQRLGFGRSEFTAVQYEQSNPYQQPAIDRARTIQNLMVAFAAKEILIDAASFYTQHHTEYRAPRLDTTAQVVLITLTALQGMCQARHIPWWVRLGLGVGHRTLTNEDPAKPDHRIPVPHPKIVVVIDDPDRQDFDWLRAISDEKAEQIALKQQLDGRAERLASADSWVPQNRQELRHARTTIERESAAPLYRVERYQNRWYAQRPLSETLGYGTVSLGFKPKIVVTTTEWITGWMAWKSLQRLGLLMAEIVDVFHTTDCLVTMVKTTVTQKRNHAVLLPILLKLREEFPGENIELIADGLGCDLTLSSNKGRNDLADSNTIIKLSWPHPNITATLGAHFGQVDDHDLMVATLLADLGNQAIGRNQGFRFQGRQAIVLIEPRYFNTLMEHRLIRYKPTPWSSKYPSFNKRTSKKSAREAIQYASEHSPLEARLLELLSTHDSFARSDEAQRLVKDLPEKQRKHFEQWLVENADADVLLAEEMKKEKRRAQVAENVRNHRARKRH